MQNSGRIKAEGNCAVQRKEREMALEQPDFVPFRIALNKTSALGFAERVQ
jgi:hypothetical protein